MVFAVWGVSGGTEGVDFFAFDRAAGFLAGFCGAGLAVVVPVLAFRGRPGLTAEDEPSASDSPGVDAEALDEPGAGISATSAASKPASDAFRFLRVGAVAFPVVPFVFRDGFPDQSFLGLPFTRLPSGPKGFVLPLPYVVRVFITSFLLAIFITDSNSG